MKRIKLTILITLSLAMVFMMFGCDGGTTPGGCGGSSSSSSSSSSSGGAVTDPTKPGTFTKCTYTEGIASESYQDAAVYHPCTGDGPFPATTLTGGWTNTYEDMSWLANHLVTHGYIILSMTPNFILGINRQWTDCHLAGTEMLIQENSRAGSAIRGKVNTNRLQVMGFSKGGGGALRAAAELGSKVVSTQGLAPYQDTAWDFSTIRSACAVLAGHNDRLAMDGRVIEQYNDIPDQNERVLAIFEGFAHGDWFDLVGDGSADPSNPGDTYKIKTYITAWMKIHLDGNRAYESYVDGHQDWFTTYAQSADAVEGQF